MEWFTIGFWGTAGVFGFILAAILAVFTLLSVAGLLWALHKRIELHNDRIAYRWDATERVVEERWERLGRECAMMITNARHALYRQKNRHLYDGTAGRNGFPYKRGEGPWGPPRPWMKPGAVYEIENDLLNNRILWAENGKRMDPQPENISSDDLRSWLM